MCRNRRVGRVGSSSAVAGCGAHRPALRIHRRHQRHSSRQRQQCSTKDFRIKSGEKLTTPSPCPFFRTCPYISPPRGAAVALALFPLWLAAALTACLTRLLLFGSSSPATFQPSTTTVLHGLTERPRKTKIGIQVAHVTRDSDTTFKIKKSTCRGVGILWRTRVHR